MNRLRIFLVSLGLLCFLGSSINFKTGAQSNESANQFEFVGRVMNLPNTAGFIGDWTVGSRTVHVMSTTAIDQEDGKLEVGALVEVKGTLRSDGSVDATRIEVEQGAVRCFEFPGVIQSLPNTAGFIGDWTVGGSIVHVTSTTLINTEEGAVAVGKQVQVEGCRRADGSIDASRIEVEESDRPACLEFAGVIQNLPAVGLIGDWTVNGRVIHVTANTLIRIESGAVEPGAFVEITGCPRTDGSIDAGKIEVERAEEAPHPFPFVIFFGLVQTLPASPFTGDWVVKGRIVHVTGSTEIDRPSLLGAGSFVLVAGGLRSDGSVDAVRIQVRQPNDFNRLNNLFELFGTVQSMPANGVIGDWSISDVIVHVGSATQLNAEHGHRITVGSQVVVVGTQRTDLTLDAIRLHRILELDDVEDFVTQQYRDFLNRDPDSLGLQNWMNTLSPCANGGFGEFDHPDCDRVHVSMGFFQSTEFLDRGYFVFRFYMIAFGQRPTYAQFVPDMASVGGAKSPQEEEQAKATFAEQFVQRPEFVARYGAITDPAKFVDALLQTAGLTSLSIRQQLIASLQNGTKTRGQVLREIAETREALDRFLVDGFVAIQYFGYLHRDPDEIGYRNWTKTLRADPNNIRHMVFGFIYSTEYRGRFGKSD